MTHLTDPWTVGAQNGYLFVVDYAYSEPDYSGVIPCKIDEATGALSDCALTTVGDDMVKGGGGVLRNCPNGCRWMLHEFLTSR